ncbi:MAG: FecR domain-containing protein [Pseudomonadota bacterium]
MTKTALYPKGDASAQAAYWFVQQRKPECTAATRRAFDLWLEESQAHREAFEAVEHAWAISAGLEQSQAFSAERREVLIPGVGGPYTARGLAVAAGAATGLAACLALVVSVFLTTPPEPVMDAQPVRAPIVASLPAVDPVSSDSRMLTTAVGQREAVTLEDGSVVELNTSTELRVMFTQARREVVLLHGQALFNVAHDASRPFIVLAGDRRITALGTEFEVRIKEDDVAVTLLDGRVEVAEMLAASSEPVVRPARVVELAPGQRLSGRSADAVQIDEAELDRALGWREGRLEFENERLGEVIEEINRYSTLSVQLARPELAYLRVSGNFRAGSTENFVAAVVDLFPLSARTPDEDPEVVLLDWRA